MAEEHKVAQAYTPTPPNLLKNWAYFMDENIKYLEPKLGNIFQVQLCHLLPSSCWN